MMKKFFFKIALLFLIVFVILSFLGESLTKMNPYSKFVSEFESSIKEGTNYDILFYGSSKSFCSFNPRIFEEFLDLNSFNLGSDAQRLETTELVLKNTLKKQIPKLLVIEINELSAKPIENKKILSFQFRCYDAFSFDKNKLIQSFNQISFEELPNLYIKAIRNHKGWKTLSKNKNDDKSNNIYLEEDYKGYVGLQLTIKNPERYDSFFERKLDRNKYDSIDLPHEDVNAITNILNICSQYNIKPLFVTSPSIRELSMEKHLQFSNKLNLFLENKGLDYLDLNFHVKEIGLSSNDYRDVTHLNNLGANKVSEYLSKWIYQKYNIGKLKTFISPKEYIQNGSFEKNNFQINYSLTNDLIISRVDYIKIKPRKMALIIGLETKEGVTDLNKYRMMYHALPNNIFLNKLSKTSIKKNRKFEIWDFKPTIQVINGKKYIIHVVDSQIEKLKTISLGLYSSKGYRGLLSSKLVFDFK